MASSSTSSASTTSPTLPTPLASRPYKHIKVRQLSRNVGGLVEAIDLRRLLADFSPEAKETRAELRQAWLDHGVLFFRNQELTNEEYLQLARVFNEPIEYPFVRGISTQFPQIIEVKKLAHETRAFGNMWVGSRTRNGAGLHLIKRDFQMALGHVVPR
jgi:taurine dioxygenase